MRLILALALLGQAIPEAPRCPEGATLDIAVRPTDLDSKGHVNNARHLEYLQWGRWRWLEDRGLTDEKLREAGAVLVAVRVEIDYRAEVRYGETVTVRTTAERDGEKKVVFRQQIIRPTGIMRPENPVAAEARVIMVAIDPATRKSIPVPEPLRKALESR